MSSPLATYSFLPWLRQGLAGQIATADGDTTVRSRASVHVALKLSGQPVSGTGAIDRPLERDVQLYGPGDIIGIDRRAIVRVEPRDWITNFEPNYLAHIEFYDEDFCWRYTPARPDATRLRLRPWIMLVVLEETEFQEAKNIAGRPLGFITAASLAPFPPADQLWAWAHVHVNRSLSATDAEFYSTDMDAVLPRFQSVLNENPDLAYSRIICPRKLDENKTYHAFLVPVFETGRLAGLGLDPATAPHATQSAWENYGGKPEPLNFPYYYRWQFRTGSRGDFEYLVRLLKPKPVDKRVGTRDIDVQEPGANLPGITDPDLGGVLKLGGALRVPLSSLNPDELAEVEKYDHWADPPPHPFQTALAGFINLADDYAAQNAADANSGTDLGDAVENNPDPLITAPLYGRWHSLTQRLLVDRNGDPAPHRDNWVHELNLDPRHRTTAGFGTRVVQQYQEDYMNAAWQQIGDVLEANRRLRAAQFAKEVSSIWYERHLIPLQAVGMETALAITAPVQGRVLAQGFTVRHLRGTSLVTPTLTSAAMRRIVRPRGRLIASLPFTDAIRPGNLLERVNRGEVSPAPPKVAPPGVPNEDAVAAAVLPANVPPAVLDWLRRYPWLRWVALVLALLVFILLSILQPGTTGLVIGIIVIGGLIWLYRLLSQWSTAARLSDGIREAGKTPQSVDALPLSPNFRIVQPGTAFTPRTGSSDSPEAQRFKTALRSWYTFFQASKSVLEPTAARLDLPAVTNATVVAINPQATIPRRTLAGIVLPARFRDWIVETFQEVMAYPRIDAPMYKPLTAISSELFLPNLNLIEQNSITLLETNQKFVESYMVGLNHEFARELLWREYPTDQRGSYFRQFWDVRSFLSTENLNDKQLKEKLRDIPEIHRWPIASKLGEHDNRERLPGAAEEEVVLVIRGELLKKYPTAVIYAQKAEWQRKEDGSIDPSKERALVELTAAEEAAPPREKLRTPLYDAKVDPDIYFFGFDLTVEDARGGTGVAPADPPGWFFVLRERGGDPRFGLDIERDGPIQTFNDLAWPDAISGATPGAFLQATSLTSVVLSAPGGSDAEKLPQYHDDVKVNPAQASAARWAYILYQAPVMVAIHAAEMLSKP